MSNTPLTRRCAECGAEQHEERETTDYPESGLSNVQLLNVPVWVCANNHRELEIPAVNQLHELLAYLVLRKPARLDGAEIRFLRRRIDMPAKSFAAKIGITAVQLSRLENGSRPITHPVDLLIRLTIALLIASRDKKPFPADLAPILDKLEAWDIGNHRVRHNDQAAPEGEWETEPEPEICPAP